MDALLPYLTLALLLALLLGLARWSGHDRFSTRPLPRCFD